MLVSNLKRVSKNGPSVWYFMTAIPTQLNNKIENVFKVNMNICIENTTG